MTIRKASLPLLCALACLASQSCVEYLPAEENPQQQPPAPPSPPPDQPQPPSYPAAYTEAPPPPLPPQPSPNLALDNLMAPIALYPDPLIAIILPASTQLGDISAAASYLIQYADVSQIDRQPWDPSVRALAHYPTVIAWMAANPEWTQALGSAFSSDPAGVMDAVQRLRSRAQAAGTLVTTQQQQVYADDGDIEIVPAQDDVIYVPVYDPEVVYSAQPYYGYRGPFINFGSACPAGIWLSYSFDWRSHHVWQGERDHDGWRQPHNGRGGPPPGAHAWHPQGGQKAPLPPDRFHGHTAPLPRPMPGAPNPPPEHYKRPITAPDHGQSPPSYAAPYPRANTPAPSERPRLNPPPATTIPVGAVREQHQLPPTNNVQQPRQAPPVERQEVPARPSREAPPTPQQTVRYVPERTMPERPAEPARDPRSQSAPVRSEPPRSEPARSAPARSEPARSDTSHSAPVSAPAPQNSSNPDNKNNQH
jgi:Protein of unknown function (DUF3300)